MNIVQISAEAPYNEGWGYQDNLLPKYQAKMGHNVTLIITDAEHRDGKLVHVGAQDYMSKDGFRVIRKKKEKILIPKITEILSNIDIYEDLVKLRPDFVFLHGLSDITNIQVVKYKKKENPNLVIVADNHLDDNILFGKPKPIRKKFLSTFFSFNYKRLDPYISRVYGVTPMRKEFAKNFFHIPQEKTDVLIMGADDECIDFAHREEIRERIRNEFGFKDDTFVIVTGGKIERNKNIELLVQACEKLNRNVQLIVFGSIAPDFKTEFENFLEKSPKTHYIGWIDASKVYDYFFASDLVVFPGRHSVLWEQACASKVPCVFKHYKGMEHVDNGGNSLLIDAVSIDALAQLISKLTFTEQYYQMKMVAESEKTDIYMYSRIAAKSLECALNR